MLGVAADVRDPAGMTGLRDAAFARFGRADLVSLNAGVALRRDVADMSEADWDWILDINLRGVIRGVTAFLPALRSRAAATSRPRPRFTATSATPSSPATASRSGASWR